MPKTITVYTVGNFTTTSWKTAVGYADVRASVNGKPFEIRRAKMTLGETVHVTNRRPKR
ncbi:MAG TPA: hypothetical protein VGM98_05690 [Schlesneria sp.]|jgi:hypothetical protein